MYPSTNNALERNNGILNQYYTNRTRQSVPALVKKLGEFLKDQVNLDKELQEVKLNREDLKLAEAFLDKHTDYFAEKDLQNSTKNHRLIIKKAEGILTSQVLTVTALPADDQTYESVKYLLAPKYNYLAPNGRGLVYTRDK